MSCTIVTAYYETPTKKHSLNDYNEWMKNMLGTIETPMVIFCDSTFSERLLSLRKGHPTEIYILPLERIKMAQGKYREYFEKDFRRDPENSYHVPELYHLWNNKTSFVEIAVQLDPFHTDFYLWCDIGCFRNERAVRFYKNWPDKKFLEVALHDKIYLLNVFPFQNGELNIIGNGLTKQFQRVDRIGGGIIFGHKNIWDRWADTFYSVLDKYMENDYFCGKDQNIMITVCALFPDLVQLVQPPTWMTDENRRWFYLEEYFS
jgi:Bacterial protein of unknown function (HtrL_YibB)